MGGTKQREFVVSVPVVFKVRRKNGDEAEFNGYLPAANSLQGDKLEEALKPLLNLACEERIVFNCITRHMNTIATRKKL